jgi:hypothetical protein
MLTINDMKLSLILLLILSRLLAYSQPPIEYKIQNLENGKFKISWNFAIINFKDQLI